MCTYNGARYLREQLESISAQTQLPSELVICDDRSHDRTRDIIMNFTERAPFPVRLHVNESTLGVSGNFGRAIALCRGSAIVLCDQDDVWRPDKLALIGRALSAGTVGAAVSDAELVDADLRPLGRRLWDVAGLGLREQEMVRRGRTLQALLPRNFVTGATMCFRSDYRELVLPIPEEPFWVHDWWIASLIGAVARLELIPDPLIRYRLHSAQQLGTPISPGLPRAGQADVDDARRFRSSLDLLASQQSGQLLERLLEHESRFGVDRKVISYLRGRTKHWRTRGTLPEDRTSRLSPVLREVMSLRYHRYSRGLRSAVRDLLS